jgi:hypothetical protein
MARKQFKFLRYITRMDSGFRHCWRVAIKHNGKMHTKEFSDRTFDGWWEKSMDAAIEYRDQLEKQLKGEKECDIRSDVKIPCLSLPSEENTTSSEGT